MGYVITNGTYYITYKEQTGKLIKTNFLEDAHIYNSVDSALLKMQKYQKKTKGYYIYDLESKTKISKHKRKMYSYSVRKKVYDKADGRCELCGRKILFTDMTIDHIKPLAVGGEDSIENYQCSCEVCNHFKGSILPDEFMERITSIYLYQTEKKLHGSFRWKIIRRLLP